MSEVGPESYPPVFRHQPSTTQTQTQNPDHLPDDTTRETQDFDDVPLIDLQSLDLEKLDEACKDWGIFRLVNHGIPHTLLTQLQERARDVFSLPFEAKRSLFSGPLVSYFWGTPALSRSGDALSAGPVNINWVEGLNFTLAQLSQLFQEENSILHSFRLLMEEYHGHLVRLATTIYEAMVTNLNLELEQCTSYLSESTGILRLYRYPHCSITDETIMGMAVHTDSSVISILSQDLVGGLEFLKEDNWHHVNPIPNTLVVNLGDMMQAISDDAYKSVKHRVQVNRSDERFSFGYFVFPAEGSVIRSSKYRPFTYSDFQAQVQEDLSTLGFKVGLERFKPAFSDD
ncbi:hypothetical protein Tsubulata_036322 [Turnera subulata]|uniref:Fe2OG dioxygenase domain-containing protein n=1 Tax=Turnera subulata TaxID=218843 RepID=A0A9Q0FGE8_9ROSI|nr:hypothetical protein Tsubulata_036322 [Turnera subulata]